MSQAECLKNIPPKVRLMEVGPRDGLQNEKTLVDTQNKVKFIQSLVDAGLKRIEVTAFVSPRWIPALADQQEVALALKQIAGVSYAALVPNVLGYERAASAGVNEVSIVVSASDTHNQKNLNANTAKVLERYREVSVRAQADKMPFRAYVSCVFGCPYEGEVAIDNVVRLAQELLALGAYEISLGDTIGVASPLDTHRVLSELLLQMPAEKLALHMHDTRGSALANIFVGLSLGIAAFDSSAGGLGGCPYAPGAAGNVATEDLLYMLHKMGIETGISLEKVCQASLRLEKVLGKAGPSKLVAIHRQTSK